MTHVFCLLSLGVPVSWMFSFLCLSLIFVIFSQNLFIVFFLFYLNFYPFHQLFFFDGIIHCAYLVYVLCNIATISKMTFFF